MSHIKIKNQKSKIKNQFISSRGVSLYLTIVILSVLTAALLALVSISISQTRIIWTMGDSVLAFYAADTGMEQVLYQIYRNNYISLAGECPACAGMPEGPCAGDLGAANYEVCVSPTDDKVIWSTGTHNATQTKRKIEITLTF